MDTITILKPYIRSSTAADVTLFSSRDGVQVEIIISQRTVDQAFQLASSTEHGRQDAVQANIDDIWKIAASRYKAERPGIVSITLDAADLGEMSMHLTGEAASEAAD